MQIMVKLGYLRKIKNKNIGLKTPKHGKIM